MHASMALPGKPALLSRKLEHVSFSMTSSAYAGTCCCQPLTLLLALQAIPILGSSHAIHALPCGQLGHAPRMCRRSERMVPTRAGITVREDAADGAARRRPGKRLNSPERWEITQLIKAGVLDVSEYPTFDEEGQVRVFGFVHCTCVLRPQFMQAQQQLPSRPEVCRCVCQPVNCLLGCVAMVHCSTSVECLLTCNPPRITGCVVARRAIVCL